MVLARDTRRSPHDVDERSKKTSLLICAIILLVGAASHFA